MLRASASAQHALGSDRRLLGRTAMPRRIAVLGACERNEMTLALRQLLPQDKVETVSPPGDGAAARLPWFMSAHQQFDVLLINHIQLSQIASLDAVRETGLRCIIYPHIHFHAFHPDLTYVARTLN